MRRALCLLLLTLAVLPAGPVGAAAPRTDRERAGDRAPRPGCSARPARTAARTARAQARRGCHRVRRVQALAGPWRRPVVPAAAALPAPGAAGTATGSSGVPTPVGEPTPTTVPDGGGAPPPPAAPPRLLGVTAREFSLVASRTVVGTGEVTVQLVNRGEDPHDLRLEPLDGQGGGGDLALTESGTTTTAKLRLEPGAYRMLCTLPQHAGLGMRGQITSAQ